MPEIAPEPTEANCDLRTGLRDVDYEYEAGCIFTRVMKLQANPCHRHNLVGDQSNGLDGMFGKVL
jgi:hypothetical protein